MVISSTLGIYIIFKYSEKITLPETQVKIPSVRTIIADVPAAKPSIPSVKFAPLETAVIINIIKGIKINQAYSFKSELTQVIRSE